MRTKQIYGIAQGLMLAMVSPLTAETEAMPSYELRPFVVVAPNTWVADVAVAGEGIRSAKPMDLASILSSALPAAALTRKGPLAGDIVLRGFSKDNVLITVDDTQTFCACPNRMDPPAFHVSSQQIEAISVRTGPFSVDQGSSVGGSVAVETQQAAAGEFGRLYGYLGSFDYYAGGGTAGLGLSDALSVLGGVYYQQGGVYENGEGVRFTALPGTNFQPQHLDRRAFEVITLEAKGTYRYADEGTLTLSYAYQDASDVLYPGLLMDAPEDTMHRVAATLRVPVRWRIADTLEASLAYSHVDHDMRDGLRLSLNNMGGAFVARGYFMRTEARSAFASGKLTFRKALGAQEYLRYGVDVSRRYWDANNTIGMQHNDMLPDAINDKFGAWAVYERRRGDWAFEAGLRLEYGRSEAREDISFVQSVQATARNQATDFLPSLYGLVSRDIADGLTAYMGVGLASRMPDPQERYLNLNRPMANPDWVGNPELDPVRNLEWQGGLEWRRGALDARASVFHAWVSDHIYLERLSVAPGDATSYTNIDARLYGVSFDGGWQVAEALRLEAGLAWQRGSKADLPDNASNTVLAEVPPLRGRVAAVYTDTALTAKAEVQFQDALERIDPDLNEVPVAGWAVLNLSVSYRLTAQLSLSAGVDNVLDKTYAVANAFVRDPFRSGVLVPEPGRFWFMRAGLEF